jgi:uncharacterized protein YcbK (DUF882 family)
MGDISENFDRSEFACKCGCGFDTVDAELIKVLEDIRGAFGVPIKINSGCRCETHNKEIGGSVHSQHKKGRAADIVVEGINAGAVQGLVDGRWPSLGGMGRYGVFTHVDTRSGPIARWMP